MSKYLYPKQIGFDTKPLEGKLYAFRFTWETTEPIGKESIKNGFDALLAWWQNTYDVLITHTMLGIEGEIGVEIAFRPKRDLDVTMETLWDFLDRHAGNYYLNLALPQAILYKPRWPWWVWALIAGGGIGATVAIARKRRK